MVNFSVPKEREQPQSYIEFPFDERGKYNLVQCVGRGVIYLTDEEMHTVESYMKEHPNRVGLNGAHILHYHKRTNIN